jgi:hypothetical protein
MKTDAVPHVLLETGSLLTLLLGGSSRVLGNGYLELIEQLAEQGLVRLDTSDMVVGEFLGICGPVYEQDLRGANPPLTKGQVPVGYALAAQRYETLKQWVDSGLITIHRTRCGDQYLERLHDILEHNPQQQLRGEEWPPSTAQIQKKLLRTGSFLAKAVKNNQFTDEHDVNISSGRQDRGEISLADVVGDIQKREGKADPIFVLYEGSDVRGRMLWRFKEPHDAQLSSNLPDHYNPTKRRESSFNPDRFKNLGNINFLTTKGFLAGMAYAGMVLDDGQRTAQKRTHHIIADNEATSKTAFESAYAGIIARVNEKGLSRKYNIRRDEPISELTMEESPYDFDRKVQRHEPWRRYMGALLGQQETSGRLCGALEGFAAARDGVIREDANLAFERLLRDSVTLPPKVLLPLLESWIEKLKEAKQEQIKRAGALAA